MHAALGALALQRDNPLVVLRREQPRAVAADGAQQLLYRVEEADVVHGPAELEMAKVARAVILAVTRLADPLPIERAHPQVAQPLGLRPPIHKALGMRHLDDRQLLELIGREHTKLDGLHLLDLGLREGEVAGLHGRRPSRTEPGSSAARPVPKPRALAVGRLRRALASSVDTARTMAEDYVLTSAWRLESEE